MNRLEQDYFEWLCSKIIDDESSVQYTKLMSHLYDVIFYPTLDMDINRAEDGKGLRRRFGIECDIPKRILHDHLDKDQPSSMLEMMVALALRCEDTIMTDDEYGDRTWIWFWDMVKSLGLMISDDSRFDISYVDRVLDRFMDRQYKRNGEGGLFVIDDCQKDMRNIEIWYQMCWYLDSI